MTIPSSRSLILWISVFSITSPSADFGRLRKTSDFFGNLRKWSCPFQESQHSQDKNLTPTSQKKLTGIRSYFIFLNFQAYLSQKQLAGIPYGGPQLSRQNQKSHGKNKNLTAKPKTSRQKQIPTAKPKLFCCCSEVFDFAVRFLVLPWCFCFCREVFGFAVTVVGHRKVLTHLCKTVKSSTDKV